MSNSVQAEPSETELERPHDTVIRIIILYREGQWIDVAVIGHLIVGNRSQQPPYLRRQNIRVARVPPQEIAHASLGQTKTVKWSRIKIANARIPRSRHCLLGSIPIHRAVETAKRGAAEPDFRYSERRVANRSKLHGYLPSRGDKR